MIPMTEDEITRQIERWASALEQEPANSGRRRSRALTPAVVVLCGAALISAVVLDRVSSQAPDSQTDFIGDHREALDALGIDQLECGNRRFEIDDWDLERNPLSEDQAIAAGVARQLEEVGVQLPDGLRWAAVRAADGEMVRVAPDALEAAGRVWILPESRGEPLGQCTVRPFVPDRALFEVVGYEQGEDGTMTLVVRGLQCGREMFGPPSVEHVVSGGTAYLLITATARLDPAPWPYGNCRGDGPESISAPPALSGRGVPLADLAGWPPLPVVEVEPS